MTTAPKILIVEAPYYAEIADELRAGAVETLDAAGAAWEIIQVPGAFEIPAAIAHAAGLFLASERRLVPRFNGYLALGCVIRGETSHYDYVCGESARGLQELALTNGLAIGFGILTTENGEQARVRAARDKKNKGGEAARAVLAMVALRTRFGVLT